MEPLTISIISAAVYTFFLWRYHKSLDKKIDEIKENAEIKIKNVEEIIVPEIYIKVNDNNTIDIEKIYLQNLFSGYIKNHSLIKFIYEDKILFRKFLRTIIYREYIFNKIYKIKYNEEKWIYFIFSSKDIETKCAITIFDEYHYKFPPSENKMILNNFISDEEKQYNLYMTDNIQYIVENQPLMDILSEEDKISLLFFGEGIEEIK